MFRKENLDLKYKYLLFEIYQSLYYLFLTEIASNQVIVKLEGIK